MPELVINNAAVIGCGRSASVCPWHHMTVRGRGRGTVENQKVPVKCRQNVANKLFMTRVFNPVRPHTWLTALSALLRLLNALIWPNDRSRQALSLCEVQNLHIILL